MLHVDEESTTAWPVGHRGTKGELLSFGSVINPSSGRLVGTLKHYGERSRVAAQPWRKSGVTNAFHGCWSEKEMITENGLGWPRSLGAKAEL